MYLELIKKAHEAGMKAAIESGLDENKGACGFAWVWFAGNTKFGKWMLKNGYASKDYPTGLHVWVCEFGQSVDLKERYAYAYAKVLKDAGLDARAGSRLD